MVREGIDQDTKPPSSGFVLYLRWLPQIRLSWLLFPSEMGSGCTKIQGFSGCCDNDADLNNVELHLGAY